MAYFLRHFTAIQSGSEQKENEGSSGYATLIQNCLRLPENLRPLSLKAESRPDQAISQSNICAENPLELDSTCQVVALPSVFGAAAIARQISLKYGPYVKLSNAASAQEQAPLSPEETRPGLEVQPAAATLHTVSMGLTCLFSVLNELNKRDPEICCSALNSLQQLLQALPPEGLSNEPYSFVQKMFALLRDLRKTGCDEVSSRASACLISLAISYGLPEFLILAACALLCDQGEQDEPITIPIPDNYREFAQNLFVLLTNTSDDTPMKTDWWTKTISDSQKLFSFTVPCDATSSPTDDKPNVTGAIASDGFYVYILSPTGLYKLGTGLGETLLGHEYASNTVLKVLPGSFLSISNGSLYLKRKHSTRLWVLDTDCLREIGEILLPTNSAAGALCSDGKTFRLSTLDSSWNLVLSELNDKFEPKTDREQKYRLTEVNYGMYGEDQTAKTFISCLKSLLLRQAVDLHVGKDVAYLLARNGKVFFCGKGSMVGLQDSEKWLELVLPETIVSISLGLDSNNALFRSGTGHVWFAGSGQIELTPLVPGTPKSRALNLAKLRQLSLPTHRKSVMSATCSASAVAFVAENGKAFVFGRHAMHCHPETGQILGLEHVHLVSIALGKTHAVALSRHGCVYTWGLNNMYQCGRVDASGSSSGFGSPKLPSEPSSSGETASSGFQLCAPAEHMWVKDVATICTACGQCSAHGPRCPVRTGSPARGSLCNCGPGESGCLRCGVCRHCGDRASPDSRSDRDSSELSDKSRRMVLSPARVILRSPNDVKVSYVSCGNYHSIMLAADGQVYTFGSNCHGQLGLGDVKRRFGPHQVLIPTTLQVVQVAAGANHCVLRTSEGTVYTFGSNRKGQLGREGKSKYWHAQPGMIPNLNAKAGTIANWIGAGVDFTLVQCQQQILSKETLEQANLTANQRCIMIFPSQSDDFLVIRKKASGFQKFSLNNISPNSSWCLDPSYDILWNYQSDQNLVTAYCRWSLSDTSSSSDLDFLKDPEFWIPSVRDPEISVSACQLGLNILALLYAMTSVTCQAFPKSSLTTSQPAGDNQLGATESDNYRFVNRFQNHGGGWGYSAQSIEAIQFQADKDITVVGFGLFGGRGEYLVRLKLLRLVGQEYDEQNLELLAESDEMLYDSGPREKAHLFFSKPFSCHAGQWYIAWVQINGPSSDCGAAGQTVVSNDDGVTFHFRNSRLSNNGTDVNAGQIPQILYQSANGPEPNTLSNEDSGFLASRSVLTSAITPVFIQQHSLLTVTPTMVAALFRLIYWSLDGAFNNNSEETFEVQQYKQEKCLAIGSMTLRLVRFYFRLLFPQIVSHCAAEPQEYNGPVVELSNLLGAIFRQSQAVVLGDNQVVLIEETVKTYIDCFHIIHPCPAFVQQKLTELMETDGRRDWPLVSLLESLAHAEAPMSIILSSGEYSLSGPYTSLVRHMLKTQHFKQINGLNFPSFLRFLLELTFAPATPKDGGLGQSRMRDAAGKLIVRLVQELATIPACANPPLLQTPSRFRRLSNQPHWDMSSGAADAVSFKVDTAGINLHGFGIYVGNSGEFTYNLEVLLNQSDVAAESWQVLEKASGTVTLSDFGSKETALLRLNKPIKLIPGYLYAARLYQNGGKTWCGEAGMSAVRTASGPKIMFQPCSLSLNGTSVTRGQIPYLLYSFNSSNMSLKKDALDSDQIAKWFLMLLRMLSVKLLDCLSIGIVPCNQWMFSKIFGWTMVFLDQNPKKALDVITAVDELLPVVASSNGQRRSVQSGHSETSSHMPQTVVESEHPYKSAEISSQILRFDSSIDYVCLEFSVDCCTAQLEDSLCIYLGVGHDQFVPVGRFSGLKGWPRKFILLPGSTLWFVLETASNLERFTAEKMYGYHCIVTGYSAAETDPLTLLEQELTWICAAACNLLVQLPSDNNAVEEANFLEEETHELIQRHGGLLRKGLNLSHVPTVREALKGVLPTYSMPPELKFLKEFISTSNNTVAGRLARWLAVDSFVDLQSCELVVHGDEVCCGRPTQISLIVKDQYGRAASCPELTVEVAVRMGPSDFNFPSDNNLPSLEKLQSEAYQPTYMNKARYISISMMPAFSVYSFEEMRLGYFRDAVLREAVHMLQRQDGTYAGRWIPRQSGLYRIECRLDGFQLPQSFHVDVHDGSTDRLGIRTRRKVAQLSRARLATCDESAMSVGIRIRIAPNLAAQQVGVIPKGSVVSYIEEIENNDGIWLRLTDEACVLHCDAPHFPTQAWCLQFNRVLNKMLLSRGSEDDAEICNQSIVVNSEEIYKAICADSDASKQLPIRSSPTFEASVTGYLQLHESVHTDGWVHNREGVWVRINKSNTFCLAQSVHGQVFLQRQSSWNSANDGGLSTAASPGSSDALSNGNAANGNSPDDPAKSMSIEIPKKKPTAQVWPQMSMKTCRPIDAISPSIADCVRSAFAAFLWHERLVKDAMACGAYLKYHPELATLHRQTNADFAMTTAPSALKPLLRIWREVNSAVHTSIQQHIILPSPPMAIRNIPRHSSSRDRANLNEELCELCETWFPVPIAAHMRLAHPGCGGHAGGQGYNSLGRYTSGWSGNCGDGGRGMSTWYLMCAACRQRYLRAAPSGQQNERNRRRRMNRMSLGTVQPQNVIKKNAMFLLELNSTVDVDSKDTSSATSGWTINLFPQVNSPPLIHSIGARSSEQQTLTEQSENQSHTSDPGPKRKLSLATAETSTQKSACGGGQILSSPSVALKNLTSDSDSQRISVSAVLRRPVLSFLVQNHDLKRVREAMRVSTFRATIFGHVFRVWNWLLRLVSTETSVADVLWHYLSALASYDRLVQKYPDDPLNDGKINMLPHPWRLSLLAGHLSSRMVSEFHAFLYTISVILRSNNVDHNLRRLCFRSWTFQLTLHEQDLLILTCNILSTVGQVLADPGTELTWLDEASLKDIIPELKKLDDVTNMALIETSSRSAMAICLTDGTTETFWESGEEDKNRTKVISVSTNSEVVNAMLIGMHIDNQKDEGFRTGQVVIYGNVSSSRSRKKLHSQILDGQFIGWVKCCIVGMSAVQIELRGPDPSLRVRLLKICGSMRAHNLPAISTLKPSPSHQLSFSASQTDAFALFQSIAAQAFGDEFSTEQSGTLRQQVLDMLFSRVQLQPLQNYVCSQVVAALEREVVSLRDLIKRNYSYCCGLLVMLSKISRSRCGIEVFSSRNNLLPALSELLLFSSAFIQCQVIDTMEKLFPLFDPKTTDVKNLVQNLLAVIAKIITLQIRQKVTHSVSSTTLADSLEDAPALWRIEKPCSIEIGRLVRSLLGDLTFDRYGEDWAVAVRTEIANHAMYFTSISDANRTPQQSLKFGRFWLAVASLSSLREKEWLECSPIWRAQTSKSEEVPTPVCENHDDGKTTAQVYCEVCQFSLCKECYTVLHLNRKNRTHAVQVITANEGCPDVDVHEGCTRLRLPWLLVLFDGTTLNGMIEFSQNPQDLLLSITDTGIPTARLDAGKCRFCQNSVTSDLINVCEHTECQSMATAVCTKTHSCGHLCGGTKNEAKCLPCLQCRGDPGLRQDADDLCVICFTDRLGGAPSIHLTCGHVFHSHCVKATLSRKWSGPRIMFTFMKCPLCQQPIEHSSLSEIQEPLKKLQDEVVKKAQLRIEYDGLVSCPAVVTPGSQFYQDPIGYALDKYVYVLCFKCGKAYFGGESQCQQAMASSQYNAEELVCGACSDVAGAQICGRHGAEYLEYKCRFCCSIAVYFCFGTTHFCTACHDDFQRLMAIPKHLLPKCPVGPRATQMEGKQCPLKVEHPATGGEEFALGCGICRNLSTF